MRSWNRQSNHGEINYAILQAGQELAGNFLDDVHLNLGKLACEAGQTRR